MVSEPKARKWRIVLQAAAVVLAAASTIVGVIWAAGSDHAAMTRQMKHCVDDVADHEARLRVLEKHCVAIGVDVRWIRTALTPPKNDCAPPVPSIPATEPDPP